MIRHRIQAYFRQMDKELLGLQNIVRADLEAQADPRTHVPAVMNNDGSLITDRQAEKQAKTIAAVKGILHG